ncbi:unnamed protein product [Mytilus coruscus]|uniref:Uncharacterized protein n=1 Tax=Mytilus coruscus TaxID=42192 RepID=A0A6J8BNR7_MYTCO|nr:unnamed protein product [Mytilus coruscus]
MDFNLGTNPNAVGSLIHGEILKPGQNKILDNIKKLNTDDAFLDDLNVEVTTTKRSNDLNYITTKVSITGGVGEIAELTSLLHGIVRSLALMLKKSAKKLNIGQYEVPGCEPLHDITNLVQNVITELPHLIKDSTVQKRFQHFIATTIGNKN